MRSFDWKQKTKRKFWTHTIFRGNWKQETLFFLGSIFNANRIKKRKFWNCMIIEIHTIF